MAIRSSVGRKDAGRKSRVTGPDLHSGNRLEDDAALAQLTHLYGPDAFCPGRQGIQDFAFTFRAPRHASRAQSRRTTTDDSVVCVKIFIERGPDFHLESLNILETGADEKAFSPSVDWVTGKSGSKRPSGTRSLPEDPIQ